MFAHVMTLGVLLSTNGFDLVGTVISTIFDVLNGVIIPIGLIGVLAGLLMVSAGFNHGANVLRTSIGATIMGFIMVIGAPTLHTWLGTQ
jgi:hypothetical protein